MPAADTFARHATQAMSVIVAMTVLCVGMVMRPVLQWEIRALDKIAQRSE